MRIGLPTVDGPAELAAHRTRQAAEDEGLDLAAAIGYGHGPSVELFLRHIAANLSGARLNEGRLGRNGNTISHLSNLELEVDGEGLCDTQRNVVDGRRPEACL